jgi:hypothetical protein
MVFQVGKRMFCYFYPKLVHLSIQYNQVAIDRKESYRQCMYYCKLSSCPMDKNKIDLLMTIWFHSNIEGNLKTFHQKLLCRQYKSCCKPNKVYLKDKHNSMFSDQLRIQMGILSISMF